MIIHNVQECEQWVKRRQWYPLLEKVLLLEPKIDKQYFFNWHIVDICNKSFQHDLNRIEINIRRICENYPKLKPIVDKLHIFMSPKPSVDTANAIAGSDYICYFARSTQIPWCMTDYITTHELGHVVEAHLCNRSKKSSRFREYLELRNAPKGICKVWVDYDGQENLYEDKEDIIYLSGTQQEKEKIHGEWDTSPAEWFAEDFRYLFGIDKQEYWGLPIEKPNDKIREFIMSL